MKGRGPWLYGPAADSAFILAPPLLAALVVCLLGERLHVERDVSLAGWLVLVVGIDVAHVYASLYRTYFDRRELARRPVLYTALPLVAWAGGVVLYTAGPRVFWSALAYLAVFHFVRQQYGFFALYARGEDRPPAERRLDAAAIYAATLYPLVWWHTHLPRDFHWFTAGDFIALPWPWLSDAALTAYIAVLGIYAAKEATRTAAGRPWNWPKNLVLAGTVLSWYVGIVALDGDLAFTATNVVSHGIPYVALVWFYGRRQRAREDRPAFRALYSLRWLPAFLAVLLVLAYFEEGLWDMLVYRDHAAAFPGWPQPATVTDKGFLALLVPLLALPQSTHYLLDGFLWRLRGPEQVALP